MRLLAGLLALAALFPAARAVAGVEAGSSFPGAITRLLGTADPLPTELRAALAAYEQGRWREVLDAVGEVVSTGEPAHALDEALFLEGLSLAALGNDDLARTPFRRIVEALAPGPYYVPAVLELVEIEERAERPAAVAGFWGKYADRPLRSTDARSRRIARLFFEFGELRAPDARLSRAEKRLLSKPEELEVLLGKRRERAADRLCYRAGLALQRLGRHRESLEAFFLIGVKSPYWPYARYSVVQGLYEIGETKRALREVRRLRRYPAPTLEERHLRSRARLLQAAILIEQGELEEGVALAGALLSDGPDAPRARLLVAEALVRAGKPALAVVYDRESDAAGISRIAAARGFTIGSAYAALGDERSAERVVREAVGRLRAARMDDAAMRAATRRLFAQAQDHVRLRLEAEGEARRSRVVAVERILAHDGPWGLMTMFRRLRAALGAGAHAPLARGIRPARQPAPGGDELWLAYLESPRRRAIENALEQLERSSGGDVSRLRAEAEHGLRAFLDERNDSLRLLSLDLEVALADALVARAAR